MRKYSPCGRTALGPFEQPMEYRRSLLITLRSGMVLEILLTQRNLRMKSLNLAFTKIESFDLSNLKRTLNKLSKSLNHPSNNRSSSISSLTVSSSSISSLTVSSSSSSSISSLTVFVFALVLALVNLLGSPSFAAHAEIPGPVKMSNTPEGNVHWVCDFPNALPVKSGSQELLHISEVTLEYKGQELTSFTVTPKAEGKGPMILFGSQHLFSQLQPESMKQLAHKIQRDCNLNLYPEVKKFVDNVLDFTGHHTEQVEKNFASPIKTTGMPAPVKDSLRKGPSESHPDAQPETAGPHTGDQVGTPGDHTT